MKRLRVGDVIEILTPSGTKGWVAEKAELIGIKPTSPAGVRRRAVRS
jgi:hypothetical protein